MPIIYKHQTESCASDKNRKFMGKSMCACVCVYAQRAQDQRKCDANVWTIFRRNAQYFHWYANDDDDDGDGDGDSDDDNDNDNDIVADDEDEPNERPKKRRNNITAVK